MEVAIFAQLYKDSAIGCPFCPSFDDIISVSIVMDSLNAFNHKNSLCFVRDWCVCWSEGFSLNIPLLVEPLKRAVRCKVFLVHLWFGLFEVLRMFGKDKMVFVDQGI